MLELDRPLGAIVQQLAKILIVLSLIERLPSKLKLEHLAITRDGRGDFLGRPAIGHGSGAERS